MYADATPFKGPELGGQVLVPPRGLGPSLRMLTEACACALSHVASDPGTLFPSLLVVSPARPLEPGSESPPQGGQTAGPGHPQSHPPELLFCGHVACGVSDP